MKFISLRLSRVRYSGASIGVNIAISINAAGRLLYVNKRLAVGTSANIGKLVGEFTSSRDPFVIPISATVTDYDPVYNDVGTRNGSFSVSLVAKATQSFRLDVEVIEAGALFGEGAAALFTLDFVVEVVETIRYVPKTTDGFLVVRNEQSRKKVGLPTALKVQVNRTEKGRDYFIILEGVLRGTTASVSHQTDGSSHLSPVNPHTALVQIEYSLSRKTATILGVSKIYRAVDDPQNPLLKGFYDVEIPDAPHRGGRSYPEAIYGRTWFRIGHSGDRYLHTGRASAGCITIKEQNRWDELYLLLISARKGDDQSIGTLHVVD